MPFVKNPPRRLSPEQRKYRPGEPLKTLAEFQAAIDNREWLCLWGDKPYHPAIAASQQVREITTLLAVGRVRRAIRNPEHPYVFIARWDSGFGWYASCDDLKASIQKATSLRSLVKRCRDTLPKGARIRIELNIDANESETR